MSPEELESLLRLAAAPLGEQFKKETAGIFPPGWKREQSYLMNWAGWENWKKPGEYIIRGFSCPLAVVVPNHPWVCKLAETWLKDFTGLPSQEN